MPDKTLVFGDPADSATRYRTRDGDETGGGNFVFVEDLDTTTEVLVYDPTAGEVTTATPINLGSNNLTTTGTVDTSTLAVDDVDESPESIASATSPVDINVDASNWWQPISLTENVDVNLNGASTGGNSLLVYFEDGDGAGPYTLTWPASVVWGGGSAITEVPQNGNQRISLTSPDGGTTWYAVDAGGGFA